ncbi:MAG: response regulator, partial [Desulfomonilaceae bacterium]
MTTSQILQDKLVLAVNEEEDVLEIIEEELSFETVNVTVHAATTFEIARQYLVSYTYDLALLDIWGIRGFDLLEIAHNANIPVVILTTSMFSIEDLRKSVEFGARACLPLEKLGSLIPFLEDVLKLDQQSAWERVFDQVGNLFTKRFGSDWRKSQIEFWPG